MSERRIQNENESPPARAGQGRKMAWAPKKRVVALSPAQTTSTLMSRIRAHLEVMGRARDQLPPIVTDRIGPLARLELWLKRRARKATRWYIWEQMNFNSATHAALSNIAESLAILNARLNKLEDAQETALSRGFASAFVKQAAAPLSEEMDPAKLTTVEVRRLQNAQRERIRLALEEMRVSFKQLTLELEETGALADPEGSSATARLNDLRGRIEELSALCEKI